MEWFRIMGAIEGDAEAVKKCNRAWTVARMEIQTAKYPWNRVPGPMGAIIAVLNDLGWIPLSMFFWLDREGSLWGYKAKSTLLARKEAMRRDIESDIWRQASKHHHGAGLEQGCDMTVARKHPNHLKQKGDNRSAGLLTTILAAGMRPATRKMQAGLLQDHACAKCGAPEDELSSPHEVGRSPCDLLSASSAESKAMQ